MSNANQLSPKAEGRVFAAIRKLAYLLMLLSVAVLAVTGLGTFFLGKSPMSGWTLMLHASAAPAFAIGLALVSLTWARMGGFSLWLVLASGLVVILSGVVPMTPVFGTNGQHFLFWTHCYSAVVVAASVLLHVVRVVVSKRAPSTEATLQPQ
jgi:hypothetical protein